LLATQEYTANSVVRVALGQLRQGRARHIFRDDRAAANCDAGVRRSPTWRVSRPPIPSWAGSIRRSALDARLRLRSTDKTIMISRADGGHNIRKSCRWPKHTASRGRNRSGPVAGGGLSLRPPRAYLALYRDADRLISPALVRSTTVMRAACDRSAVASEIDLGETPKRPRKNLGPASGNRWNGVTGAIS
jgi:hypothetical protein